MADEATDQESKTEEPSERRKEEFRNQGQIAYSREIGSTMSFVSILTTLYWLSGMFYHGLENYFNFAFSNLAPWAQHSVPFASHIAPMLRPMIFVVLCVLIVAFLVPLIAHGAQKGFDPKYEAATPSLAKLNPMNGISNLFSKDTLLKTALNFLRTGGMLIIFYMTVRPFIDRLVYAAQMPFESTLGIFLSIFASLLKNAVIFLAVLASLDYFFKWRMMHSKMMMSRQELKDEMKNMEGNPEIKSKIKQIQRERSKRRANREVPKATVVITNPTHFAVAIKYVRGEMMVPRVVSKGNDYLALKIREIAKEHRVPIIENPPLARALYRDVKEGQDIPNKYFKPVAKIIATILRLEQEKKAHQLAMLSAPYRQVRGA